MTLAPPLKSNYSLTFSLNRNAKLRDRIGLVQVPPCDKEQFWVLCTRHIWAFIGPISICSWQLIHDDSRTNFAETTNKRETLTPTSCWSLGRPPSQWIRLKPSGWGLPKIPMGRRNALTDPFQLLQTHNKHNKNKSFNDLWVLAQHNQPLHMTLQYP